MMYEYLEMDTPRVDKLGEFLEEGEVNENFQLSGLGDDQTDAQYMYSAIGTNSTIAQTQQFKTYWPAIQKAMAQGQWKTALTYLKWLGAKVGISLPTNLAPGQQPGYYTGRQDYYSATSDSGGSSGLDFPWKTILIAGAAVAVLLIAMRGKGAE